MPNIRAIDLRILDDIFGMGGGYVLDFSNRTFSIFFEELNIDIYDERYAASGTSKANRLRCFLQNVDKATAARVLRELWEYREKVRGLTGREDTVPNVHGRLLAIVNALEGVKEPAPSNNNNVAPAHANRDVLISLKTDLLKIASLDAQPRGYAFENFLKNAFDKHGLQGRGSFRLVGEQIDGSFQLGSDTYLLEARWQNAKTPADHLRSFNGKVEEKAGYTRGLFVSYSGFTDEGLTAYGGRGKRIVCMDGLDLNDLLERELPLNIVLEKKIRRFAETGYPFVPLRDLFPS